MRSWQRRAVVASLAAGFAAAPVATGCDSGDALVGGQCLPGWVQCGSDCCPVSDATSDVSPDVDAMASDGADGSDVGSRDGPNEDRTAPGDASNDVTSSDGNPGEASVGDGSPGDGSSSEAEAGIVCTPPLVPCGGMCVDTSTDPLNCGMCFNVCPSLICQNSMCIGTTAGGIVYAGHDYLKTPAGTAQARVLSNAVFIPQNNPLSVMSFEHYAAAQAVTRVDGIVNGVATQLGRVVNITSTTTDTDIPAKLTFQKYQVLIVHDQVTAPAGAMVTLGASWQTTLVPFTLAGGIVIVLDGGTGTGEMPAFSTSTTLLTVTAHVPDTGAFLSDVAPFDSVGVGVVSPYAAGKNSVSLTTEPSGGSVIYVIDQATDAGPGAPVVVHKVF